MDLLRAPKFGLQAATALVALSLSGCVDRDARQAEHVGNTSDAVLHGVHDVDGKFSGVVRIDFGNGYYCLLGRDALEMARVVGGALLQRWA